MPGRPIITSVHNPAVLRLRALREGGRRGGGELFLAEGVRLLGEALAAGARLAEVVVSPRIERDEKGRDLLARLERAHIPLRRVSDRVLASLSDTEMHQGALAAVGRPALVLAGLADPGRAPLLVVAAGVQEPGNLGALVRIAEAFGAGGLVACDSADPWGPKAVRASAASIFRLPVVAQGDAAGVLAELRARGYRLAGAVSTGGLSPGPALLRPPLAIAFGSEGRGLPRSLLGADDIRVTVPLAPAVDSLNVAAAAAVVLFAATRER